jgi:hypothetical protein
MADFNDPGSKGAPNPQSSVAAGTLARDANEVKVTPQGWIRERVHIGDGHYAWSLPFDPLARAAEEAAALDEKMAARGAMTIQEREALGEKVRHPPAPEKPKP